MNKLDKIKQYFNVVIRAALIIAPIALLVISSIIVLTSSTTKTDAAIYKTGSAKGNGYTIDVWYVGGSTVVVVRSSTGDISVAK